MAQLQFLKSAVPNQRKAVEVAKDTSDGEAGDASGAWRQQEGAHQGGCR